MWKGKGETSRDKEKQLAEKKSRKKGGQKMQRKGQEPAARHGNTMNVDGREVLTDGQLSKTPPNATRRVMVPGAPHPPALIAKDAVRLKLKEQHWQRWSATVDEEQMKVVKKEEFEQLTKVMDVNQEPARVQPDWFVIHGQTMTKYVALTGWAGIRGGSHHQKKWIVHKHLVVKSKLVVGLDTNDSRTAMTMMPVAGLSKHRKSSLVMSKLEMMAVTWANRWPLQARVQMLPQGRTPICQLMKVQCNCPWPQDDPTSIVFQTWLVTTVGHTIPVSMANDWQIYVEEMN
ncbi:hypothetical protein BDN71DRAFT_1430597 [Pleurotus eryngii]|uniref:Uncharacterized protein n=1 Tax=Pleurotus eryngii TaxID=5323 RepID=A0A9P5ZZF0_PLEER|nr:hypothetical protein BDN71DRAFT_1430597 [Pleurotus eryngii]